MRAKHFCCLLAKQLYLWFICPENNSPLCIYYQNSTFALMFFLDRSPAHLPYRIDLCSHFVIIVRLLSDIWRLIFGSVFFPYSRLYTLVFSHAYCLLSLPIICVVLIRLSNWLICSLQSLDFVLLSSLLLFSLIAVFKVFSPIKGKLIW